MGFIFVYVISKIKLLKFEIVKLFSEAKLFLSLDACTITIISWQLNCVNQSIFTANKFASDWLITSNLKTSLRIAERLIFHPTSSTSDLEHSLTLCPLISPCSLALLLSVPEALSRVFSSLLIALFPRLSLCPQQMLIVHHNGLCCSLPSAHNFRPFQF